MRVVYGPGCDEAWRAELTPWQHRTLAALHRQGRGLPDGTDHGSDERWRQAGVRTRDSYGTSRRTRPDDHSAHQRIIIKAEPYGFTVLGVRKTVGYEVDEETGEVSTRDFWTITLAWHVGRSMSANHETAKLHGACA